MDQDDAMITGEVALPIDGTPMTVRVTVPSGLVPLSALLPIFEGVASAIVDHAEAKEAAAGRAISCRAGCGACCRQPVPVSPAEARGLAALVEAMPEPRQAAVRARFAAARADLAAAGVDTRREALARHTASDVVPFALGYTAKHVACPFLEEESCSIHPHRPSICREYLVTTPAENCRSPKAGTVRRVPIWGQMSHAILAIDHETDAARQLLLVDSLDFAATEPPPPPTRTGPALVQAVFASLTRRATA